MDENKMVMPVAPMANNGNGLFGGGDSWLGILFLIALLNGGMWGGFGGCNGWGMMNGMWGMDGLYPWLNNSQNISGGFRDQMLNTSIGNIQNGIISGFGDVQTALCGGFAGVNATVNNAQNAISQQLYSNQIADLERSFNSQTATINGMNNIAMNLQNCCCENRASVADLKYTVATENCADRAALSDGIREIIANNTASTQKILDQLCQDKIDAKNEKIAELQQQVLMRDLAASQSAQTNQLIADNTAQTQYIVNRVAPYPVPAYTVGNPYQSVNNCGCSGCSNF